MDEEKPPISGTAKMLDDNLGWVPYVPEPTCDIKRGPRSTVTCEMPPGHDGGHCGRSRAGRWFSYVG